MTIEQAATNAIEFIANGWDIETAVLAAHDTVYDEISADDFVTLVQRQIRERIS